MEFESFGENQHTAHNLGDQGNNKKNELSKKGTCLINRIKKMACPHQGVPGVTRWVPSTPTPVFFPHQLNSSLQR